MNHENNNNNNGEEQPFLQHFWHLVTFKKLPVTVQDVRILIQVEMMKFHSRAVICKIPPTDTDKYTFGYFVKDRDSKYYCNKSKLVVKEHSEVRTVIDNLLSEGMKWGIETNLDGSYYLIASWKDWGE